MSLNEIEIISIVESSIIVILFFVFLYVFLSKRNRVAPVSIGLAPRESSTDSSLTPRESKVNLGLTPDERNIINQRLLGGRAKYIGVPGQESELERYKRATKFMKEKVT